MNNIQNINKYFKCKNNTKIRDFQSKNAFLLVTTV